MTENLEHDVIKRWQRAAARAEEEHVRIVEIGGQYWATSASRPLGSYHLQNGSEGWTCECIANREYGMPCKHLWALAAALNLDVLQDIRVVYTAPPAQPAVA